PIGNYNAYEIMKDLATYVRGNDFIDNIDIIFNNETIISNTYKVKNSFYSEYLNGNRYDITSLSNIYSYKRISSVNLKGGTSLYYINSLPIGNKRVQRATVVIKLNSNFIKDLIENNQLSDKTET